MKSTIQPNEPDPTFKCPICGQTIVSYLQDAYNHVLFKHMDQVRANFKPEEINLFLKGFTWEQSTNNQQSSNKQ